MFLKLLFFFFFKQKTADEMRISDGSSDVCSSDLIATEDIGRHRSPFVRRPGDLAVGCKAGKGPEGRVIGIGAEKTDADLAAPLGADVQPRPREEAEGRRIAVKPAPVDAQPVIAAVEIGRASCRERVCQYV